MKTEIQIPTVPNALRVLVGGKEVTIFVQDIPENELKEVGEKWTRQLLAKAKTPKLENL